MANNETIKKTLIVATSLCIVCSILVSGAAVFLKSKQELNKELDIKKNILSAAGLIKDGNVSQEEITSFFQEIIEAKIIDIDSGEIIEDSSLSKDALDLKRAVKIPEYTYKIPSEMDVSKIKVRPKNMRVYFVNKNSVLDQIILPVYGKGLWSTLYGFLSLDKDTTTIRGLTFYEHGETPGLGGEIDNPKWKAQWPSKKAYDENWNPAIHVIKGLVDLSREESKYQIDGLSGSTLTSRGVTNLLKYWLGQNGYAPFLEKMRSRN